MIILHTRWHPDDLSGYLLKDHPDDWHLIRLPAIAEQSDPMRRPVGTPLCPQLHTLESLMGNKQSQGIWDAVYQQDPQGLGDDALYHHFSEARNVSSAVTLNPTLPLHIAIDFNKRPGSHMLVGQYDKIADTITTVHEFYGDRWDTIQIMKDFTERWWPIHGKDKGFPEIHVFGDSAGNSESIYTSDSGYKIIQRSLAPLGVQVYKRVPKKAPGITNSVLSTNDALTDIESHTHWLIHPRCKKLIRDLMEVMPDEHGKPDKDADFTLTHASDAERYRVHRIRPLRLVQGGGKVNV